jgi:hypothetical protein
MRKLIASVVALLPLLAAAQEAAQPPPPQAEPPSAQQAPQYPPQYAPPPQYTPPPPQGQYQPQPAQAQPQPYRKPGHQRDSWYIGFGIGGGDASVSWPDGTYSMKEEFGTSPTKVTMNFKVGATLTPRLLLGADMAAFAASATYDTIYGEADQTLGISTVTGMVTFFPMETGLFLRGGLGLASFSEELKIPGATYSVDSRGVAYAAGVGYAFWLGRSFNLTANLDFSGQSYGGGDGPDSTRFWALGLGFDWY